jgi:hypothetical protein
MKIACLTPMLFAASVLTVFSTSLLNAVQPTQTKLIKLQVLQLEETPYDPTDNFAPLLITVEKRIEASNHSDLSFFHPLSSKQLRGITPVTTLRPSTTSVFEQANFFKAPFKVVGVKLGLGSFFPPIRPAKIRSYNYSRSTVESDYSRFIKIKAQREKKVWDSMSENRL